MRRAAIIFGMLVATTLVAVWFLLGGAAPPKISVTFVGYTNVSSDEVAALFKVRNGGPTSVDRSGQCELGRADGTDTQGSISVMNLRPLWTLGQPRPPFTGQGSTLLPHAEETVLLGGPPADSETWCVGFTFSRDNTKSERSAYAARETLFTICARLGLRHLMEEPQGLRPVFSKVSVRDIQRPARNDPQTVQPSQGRTRPTTLGAEETAGLAAAGKLPFKLFATPHSVPGFTNIDLEVETLRPHSATLALVHEGKRVGLFELKPIEALPPAVQTYSLGNLTKEFFDVFGAESALALHIGQLPFTVKLRDATPRGAGSQGRERPALGAEETARHAAAGELPFKLFVTPYLVPGFTNIDLEIETLLPHSATLALVHEGKRVGLIDLEPSERFPTALHVYSLGNLTKEFFDAFGAESALIVHIGSTPFTAKLREAKPREVGTSEEKAQTLVPAKAGRPPR